MHDHKALGPLLGYCGHLGRERMDARLTERGIETTPAQTHVLLHLHRHGGEVPQGEVVSHLRVKPSTANGILDRMEEKGLVERFVSPQDARQKCVTITPKGLEKQEQFREIFAETESVMLKGLSAKEQETLFDLLHRVLANLEEDRRV